MSKEKKGAVEVDYKGLCFNLAGKVADAIELLIKAQQEGEEEYMGIAEPKEVQDD